MNNSKKCSAAPKWGSRLNLALPGFCAAGCMGMLIFIFQACGSSREQKESLEMMTARADSVQAYLPGIAADTINGTIRHFVRSAGLKCRVGNVMDATKRIEDLTAAHGGYIAKSSLSSLVNYNNALRFKEDSLLESTFYTTSNTIVLQVPCEKLDTLLRKITGMALFVDYRNTSADDVKMQLLENKMAGRRYNKYTQKLEKNTATKNVPVKQAVATADALLEKQGLADQEDLNLYKLAQEVNYSKVTVEIYQPQQEQRIVTPMQAQIKPFEPAFITKTGQAFLNGFELLKTCILFLINAWGFFFICGLLFFVIRRIARYFKTQPGKQ